MSGRGPAPKDPSERRRRNKPARGEVTSSPEVGWQHGPMPAPPPKVLKATRDVWAAWFGSWFAARWTPEDLAGIYVVGKLYDAVMRGELSRANELRISMDAYGMTPKGQQDRRWKRPEAPGSSTSSSPAKRPSRYGHLRVAEGESSGG